MVLESTMICVDDSEYMRNGDFIPTRMAAVQDAVNIVCLTKTRANPENNVGLLTLASSEVLSTLTTDSSKLMSKMLACQPAGELQLMSGLRKAHLALKHRQGKNHKMRIVVFVGSPLDNQENSEWIRLAKKLKKEKVNVDIVVFGDGSSDVLQEFVETLNGRDGTASHLVVVQQGAASLADALMASPILQSEDGMPIAGGAFDFGIDPNDDPELALALRVSMEEQRSRQEADSRSGAAEVPSASGGSSEDQMLERALAISQQGSDRTPAQTAAVDFGSMTEDEQIAYAMQMSMQDASTAQDATGGVAPMQVTEASDQKPADVEKMEVDETSTSNQVPNVVDEGFVQSVLEGLPTADSSNSKSGSTGTAEAKPAQPPSPKSPSSRKSATEKKKGDPKKK